MVPAGPKRAVRVHSSCQRRKLGTEGPFGSGIAAGSLMGLAGRSRPLELTLAALVVGLCLAP